jgi:hypothetical protein
VGPVPAAGAGVLRRHAESAVQGRAGGVGDALRGHSLRYLAGDGAQGVSGQQAGRLYH